MPFKKDTFNDLQIFENPSDGRFVDVSYVMKDRHAKVIIHNATSPVNDLFHDEEKYPTYDFRSVKKIRIRKKIEKNSDDVFFPKRSLLSLAFSKKSRRTHLRTISIIDALENIPKGSIDIRNLEPLTLPKHPDIFLPPLPVHRTTFRFFRRHKDSIFHVSKKTGKITLTVGIFAAAIFFFAIGLKSYIQSETIKQYQYLYNLKTIRDPEQFTQESEKIRNKFARLGLLFAPIDLAFDNRLYSNETVKLAHDVINGGKEVASTAVDMGELWKSFDEYSKKEPANQSQTGNILDEYKHVKLTNFLRENEDAVQTFQDHLARIVSYYGGIKSLGDPALDEKFNKAFEALYATRETTDYFVAHFKDFLYILGDEKPMRYLIMNQNRDELRANGGFPGSVIYVELYKGQIKKWENHDIYDYDWKVYPYAESSPGRLAEFGWPKFGLRDANYYPRFIDSAEKINFFFEKAGGSTLDGIIGINQGLVQDVLKKYGDVALKDYNLTFTSENFSLLMSSVVEAKVIPYKKLDAGHEFQSPKKLVFLFKDELAKKLTQKRDILGYLNIFKQEVDAGEIVFAARDSKLRSITDSMNLQEKWTQDQGNWIYPVFMNIGGNKSDRYMKRDFTMQSKLTANCTVFNLVKLTSRHTISENEKITTKKLLQDFGITNPEDLFNQMNIQGSDRNKQYVRFILPPQSKLDPNPNAIIKQEQDEAGYSIVSALIETKPGASSDLQFSYTTSPKNCSANPVFYKQPGLTNYTFSQVQ